jgi:hypothetical protein
MLRPRTFDPGFLLIQLSVVSACDARNFEMQVRFVQGNGIDGNFDYIVIHTVNRTRELAIVVRPNMDRHPEGAILYGELSLPTAEYAAGELISGAGYTSAFGILNVGGSITHPPIAFVLHVPGSILRNMTAEIEFHDVERQIDSGAESSRGEDYRIALHVTHIFLDQDVLN